MTEPKRRGRPPKAKPNAQVEGANVGCAECGRAVGHYDDCPVGMGVEPAKAKFSTFSPKPGSGRPIAPGESIEVYRDPFDVKLAQAYALRVWNGQSPDVPRAERLRRVKIALDGQGLSMEGVVL
jgi:hypothetical protein